MKISESKATVIMKNNQTGLLAAKTLNKSLLNKLLHNIRQLKTSDIFCALTALPATTQPTDNHQTTKDNADISRISTVKTFLHKSGIFAAALLIAMFLLSGTMAMAATKTWNKTIGGDWKTTSNWTPSGVPGTGDDVDIPANQSSAITRLSSDGETISLNSLTINGNVRFEFDPGLANACTLNINGTLTVAESKTFTVGISDKGRLNFTLAATATGNIAGTVFMNSYSSSGYNRTFTNNGNLSITTTGLLTGQNTSLFTLNSGATLQIGSLAGITTSGATGSVQIPGTRTYSQAANYIYIGTADQVTGNALTTTNNLTINTSSPSVTVTSSGAAFTVANNLTVTQGNLILLATDASYTVSNDLTVAANGTLTHSVNWDGTSKLLAVGGNIAIDGIFQYTTRSHVQMTSSATKTVRTGANAASAFSILTLLNGTFNASGTLKVNDNLWAMFGSTGSFHTNGQTVTASSGVQNNNGTVFIDGGILNVTAGLTVGAGTTGTNGTVVFSSGTLNADVISVGNGIATGTFTQSSGTSNVSGSILINPSCSFTCTNSPAINISGNFTNNGTYTKANETVTFNGADQTIGGSVATSFGNLVFSGSGSKTVPSGTSVAGNLSISGSKANLNAGITVSVNSLTLDGAAKSSGTWGSFSSAATYKTDTYFTATTGTLNVATGTALPTPTFSSLTANQSICPGTSTTTLSGVVSSVSDYPANGETVGVTINNVTQNTTIVGSTGGFTVNYNVAAIPASGTPYTITYSYGGGNYLSAAVNNSETAVTISAPVPAVTGQTNITCNGGTDGSVTITASEGVAPYQYSVNNGETYTAGSNPYTYTGLSANVAYKIRIKDSLDCESPVIP